ncbi:Glutathione S-transferase Mu 7, partial [Ophiophagus hannah]
MIAPDYDKSKWISEKEKLGLDFPNEKLKPGYLEQLPGKLKLFSQFLGDRKWFAGDKITFVDFLMYDVLDQNRMFEPKCLDQFKNLQDFLTRFELAHSIRLLLEYTGTSYEDKLYSCGEGGETEEELIRVDMLENQVMDFRMALGMICYNPDFALEKIAAYMSSSRFMKTPINNKMAKWGNEKI